MMDWLKSLLGLKGPVEIVIEPKEEKVEADIPTVVKKAPAKKAAPKKAAPKKRGRPSKK